MATWRFCDGAVTNLKLPMKDEPANKGVERREAIPPWQSNQRDKARGNKEQNENCLKRIFFLIKSFLKSNKQC